MRGCRSGRKEDSMAAKKKVLFVITQFYKGGAEVALLNLFRTLSPKEYEIDFLIFDQIVLKNAQSLIEEIPSWIRVCNAAEREGRFAIIFKIWSKIYQKVTKRQLYRRSAYQFVRWKRYDMAFSYGVWLSPEFVAKKVKAKKKMVWIHTDIDKANYVEEKILFGFDKMYDRYIFVSEQSKKSAEKRFSFLKRKSVVVHNMCDEKAIRLAAEKSVSGLKSYPKPWLLSVGNLREEKNYPRQIEVMRILKERGITLTWFCIGSTANYFVCQKVKELLEQYQLQDQFILLGVKKNPYPYMKQADAVMVLSDFESWSFVITEAKVLGVPVIATATSGAKEQLVDGKTGIITSFEPKEIAEQILEYLNNPLKKEQICKNLKGFSAKQDVIKEFQGLFS